MGDAKIKAEFLIHVPRHVKSIEDEPVKKEENGDASKKEEGGGDVNGHVIGEPAEKKSKIDEEPSTTPGENSNKYPKSNKKDRKGQNKNRPPPPKFQNKQKLCTSLVDGDPDAKCNYQGCTFIHDIKEYLDTKEAALDKECPTYKTYGKCGRGLTCVFSSSHMDPTTFRNMVNEELWEKMKSEYELLHKYILDKDAQIKLRKKKYNFKKTEKIVEKINKQLNYTKHNKNQNNKSASDSNGKEEEEEDIDGEEKEDSTQEEGAIVKEEEETEVKNEVLVESAEENTSSNGTIKTSGALTDQDLIPLKLYEIKKIDWKDKLYLSPLTTVGNLPFRRICVDFGADITCSEMSLAQSIAQGNAHEFALHRRHTSEKIWGVQLCANNPWVATKAVQILNDVGVDFDFIDLNTGCPLDNICKMGGGAGLMARTGKLECILRSLNTVVNSFGKPFTVKIRTGVKLGQNFTHKLIPMIKSTGISALTIHGRTRDQRYMKSADWNYIGQCVKVADSLPVFGNGDVFSWEEYEEKRQISNVAGVMIGRGALMKPWIFQEIKERRHIDMSSTDRLEILQRYCNYGLDHWGSDTQGVETTRRFLLEWISFYYRYIPLGVLEEPPQKMNDRPPKYRGRDEMETLLASHNVNDWIKISEMFLGKAHESFAFLPKHKANAWG